MSIVDDVRLALRNIQLGQRTKYDIAKIAAAADEWLRHYDLLSALPPSPDKSGTDIEDAVGVAVMGYLQARQGDAAPISPVDIGRAALGPIRLRAGYGLEDTP